MLFDRPRALEGLGRPSAGALPAPSLGPCAIEILAAEALVVLTTGAAFFDASFFALDFSGEVGTSGISLLTDSTRSSSSSRAAIGSSGCTEESRSERGGVAADTAASSRSS